MFFLIFFIINLKILSFIIYNERLFIMAIIRSGVLGNTRGKVAGVVGSQWKDKNYLREYVKPANPNTAAQQVQRGLMRLCVAFAKSLVGPVFNAYTDKFLKSMSGYNAFIKANIALFTTDPTYASVVISQGKLSPVSGLAATYDTGIGNLVLTWNDNLGNNGAADDKVYWVAYHKVTLQWHFADAEVTRTTETDNQMIGAGLTATDFIV